MKDVSGNGRTVLFVSHNMTAVQNLCSKSILLKNGSINKYGKTDNVIKEYLLEETKEVLPKIIDRTDRKGTGKLKFIDYQILSLDNIIKTGETVIFRLFFKIQENCVLNNVEFAFSINTLIGNSVLVFSTDETRNNIKEIVRDGYIDCVINEFLLTGGIYSVNIFAQESGLILDHIVNAFRFNVDDSNYYIDGASKHPNHPLYLIKHRWEYKY
jgi:lipopolysaccharide transport system ATP-binding protein